MRAKTATQSEGSRLRRSSASFARQPRVSLRAADRLLRVMSPPRRGMAQ